MLHQPNGEAPRKASIPYLKTDTPGVYRRSGSYVTKWRENGESRQRTFPTYAAACAFRRDVVIPFRQREALPPTVAAPRGQGRGFVYLLQSKGPDCQVKIGWSQDVARRIRELSTAHPHGVDLVGLVLGPMSLEARLHLRFAHLRIRGEWFSREVLDQFSMTLAGDLGLISVSSATENGG